MITMDTGQLNEAIKNYGTPLFIFNVDEMKENVELFRKNLRQSTGVCFAMKANPMLVRQMAAVTDRIEVCSMGEFEICREQEIEPEKILISGVLKKEEDIREILDYYRGACTYTVESVSQFEYFAKWCAMNRQPVRLYLRLTSGNQFGMDEQTIHGIIEMRKKYPLLEIKGIHFFSGTQKKSAEKIAGELAYLDDFMLKLEEDYGFAIEELEYGPGISVSYFKGQEDKMEEEIRRIAAALAGMTWKGSTMLEMGRALTAVCGYYLTSVKDIKQSNGNNYCIVDGGIHQLNYDGQIKGMYCPRFLATSEDRGGEQEEYTVCGSLCTINDVLIQKAVVPKLKTDDVLIFERAGAYAITGGMSLFLSHELPRAVLCSRQMGWKTVREELQTYKWNMEKGIDDGRINEYFNGN